MTERITKISEVSDLKIEGNYYNAFDGYEVTTDRQRILLLIENGQLCCERSGYFWSNDSTAEFLGAEVRGVSVTDDALNTKALADNEAVGACLLFVNIETDRGVMQFVAYNDHNGYYAHDAVVRCEQLSLTESL